MDNQQLRPKGKVQRLFPLREVDRKPYRNGVPIVVCDKIITYYCNIYTFMLFCVIILTPQNDYGEDIVCSRMKVRGDVKSRQGVATL